MSPEGYKGFVKGIGVDKNGEGPLSLKSRAAPIVKLYKSSL